MSSCPFVRFLLFWTDGTDLNHSNTTHSKLFALLKLLALSLKPKIWTEGIKEINQKKKKRLEPEGILLSAWELGVQKAHLGWWGGQEAVMHLICHRFQGTQEDIKMKNHLSLCFLRFTTVHELTSHTICHTARYLSNYCSFILIRLGLTHHTDFTVFSTTNTL